jgi:hypothetical protein
LTSTYPSSDGSPISGIYLIDAPTTGDAQGRPRWGSPDNGVYTISLEPSQVTDTSNNFANAATLGTFIVNCETTGPAVGGILVAYELARALKGVVDEDRFEALSGTVSLPFPAGKHKRVAVKVIDPRGNEVMCVQRL